MSKALLVMDIEPAILKRIEQPEPLLQRIKETVAAARKHNIQVIYVTVSFRPGFPEIGTTNKLFNALKSNTGLADKEASFVHPALEVFPEDIHVIKKRISAFAGSDLELLLRAHKIDELIVCGVSTSGVVLSTIREAADKDFILTVIEDCCNDADAEVHRVLTQKVFTRQATVLSHSEWIHNLQSPREE